MQAPTGNVLMLAARAKAGEDNINCERLTTTERAQLAVLMSWPRSPSLAVWIADVPSAQEPHGPCYEGAILRRQEDEIA